MFPIDMALATDLAKRRHGDHGQWITHSETWNLGWTWDDLGAEGSAEDVICDTLSMADMTRHGEPRSQSTNFVRINTQHDIL